MSRVGKKVIQVPKGTQVKIENKEVTMTGAKGTLKHYFGNDITVSLDNGEITIHSDAVHGDSKTHGLHRALINNLVIGVSQGFSRRLELIGVGFRAAVQNAAQIKTLDLQLGYSDPISVNIPIDLQVAVEKNTLITIAGADKQRVGQFAAQVRSFRPPEPYKGKGVRYEGEYVRKKAGKTGKGK